MILPIQASKQNNFLTLKRLIQKLKDPRCRKPFLPQATKRLFNACKLSRKPPKSI